MTWSPDGAATPPPTGSCASPTSSCRHARGSTGRVVLRAGGAGDEHTLRDSSAAWARHRLLPHSMVDVSGLDRDDAARRPLAHPVLVAPTATHVRYHPGAELETLRGAAAGESLMTLSSLGSTLSSEFGAEASRSDAVVDAGLPAARPIPVLRLPRRAVESGASALVLTVDTPSLGRATETSATRSVPSHGVIFPTLAHLPAHHDPRPRTAGCGTRTWPTT